MAESTGTDSLFTAMEELARLAAALTGVRSQLIDAGWSTANAEMIAMMVADRILRGQK